ncbi:MAG TPA: hypothetical protein ENG74_03985, partial [Thermoplasmatales archaeon]|nr:hypothetical protein [Thermoplasmatales archaeon]
MKKMWAVVVIATLLMLPLSAMAIPSLSANKSICSKSINRERLKMAYKHEWKHKVKVRGIWGYESNNNSSGIFAGVMTKTRKGIILFKGIWKTDNNSSKGKIFGIMKKGYFNGRVITEGKVIPITGLYKVNREKRTIRMKWLMPNNYG